MTKLSEKILAEIEKERIAPIPRWHFLVKNYVFWTLFAIAVILGSLSFSVIVDLSGCNDLDLISHREGNIFLKTVMLLPYFWILSLGIFALIAFINWKHTRKGYCLRRRWIFLASIMLSIFLGSAFYALGWGRVIDEMMAETIPSYDFSKHNARSAIWQQPETGFLMGKIVEIDDEQRELMIRDEKDNLWNIDEEAARWVAKDFKEKGKVIKIIGSKTGEREFRAKEIRHCRDCRDDDKEDYDEDEKDDDK